MILVDTSVWIDHTRVGDVILFRQLEEENVLAHPYVIGELAVGILQNRRSILDDLRKLPKAVTAQDEEVLTFISEHHLFGTGIGYIDAHLLVAAKLTPGAGLWTRDKRLRAIAERLKLSWPEPKPS